MQPDQYQEPEYYARPSYRGVIWLNGITWAILVVCFLLAALAEGYTGLVPMFIVLVIAGASAVVNLIRGIWLYGTDRGRQGWPFLLGFLPLALLAWWLWDGFSHVGKIGG